MKILDHLEEWLIALLMASATVIVFIAVVHRYLSGYEIPYVQDWLLGIDLGWAQELTIILFVWMAKFGAAYGVRTGIHVGVDVLINRLNARNRNYFIIFGLFAGASFTFIIGSLGWRFVLENGMQYQVLAWLGQDVSNLIEGPVTPDLEWPTWMCYMALPLGSWLMCLRFVQVMVHFIKYKKLPHHDHAHVDGLEEE